MREHYPLEILLPIAKLARSTFFYHRSSKPDRDSTVKARIRDIKQVEPNYGYRRVSAKLVEVNHKCLQRLIEEMGLQVHTKKRRKYRSYVHIKVNKAKLHRTCYNGILVRVNRMRSG